MNDRHVKCSAWSSLCVGVCIKAKSEDKRPSLTAKGCIIC